MLAGEESYDTLEHRDQAVVRASWDERITERIASLDLAAEFTQAGRSWTEADEQGNAVTRNDITSVPSADQ
ncbi:hypothetical protein [Leucobacter insecticola]|uniref:hypothetical protein n=1 Tax=Leucobacter insecticola TaxID=2714934 RepID=UPI001FCAED2B|nr:hypothetical protein [Leucobacter insecticola]